MNTSTAGSARLFELLAVANQTEIEKLAQHFTLERLALFAIGARRPEYGEALLLSATAGIEPTSWLSERERESLRGAGVIA